METEAIDLKKIFPPTVLRIGLLISIALLSILFFITSTAKPAHSDSEVKYKQKSIFRGVSVNVITDNSTDKYAQISISYEVDKITPTPIPIINISGDEVWIRLAHCESRQNWSINTGNGYYGGLQFSLGAWASVGGQGNPSDASKEEQISKGKILQQRRGWGPWGNCAKKLGLL